MEIWREELYHFQRIGARWGDRNGPPYPLSRAQLSSKERALDSKNHFSSKSENTHTEDRGAPKIDFDKLFSYANKDSDGSETDYGTPKSTTSPKNDPKSGTHSEEVPETKTGKNFIDAFMSNFNDVKKEGGAIANFANSAKKAKNAGKPPKDLSYLSNEEMQAAITRINLEKAYRQATVVPDYKAEKKAAQLETIVNLGLAAWGGYKLYDKIKKEIS